MTVVMQMIDQARYPRDIRRCADLVRDHIASGVEPRLNDALMYALALRWIEMLNSHVSLRPREVYEISGKIKAAYYTDPPRQETRA